MINRFNSIFWVYITFLLLLAPIHLLSFDTYYYWDWSRHLALSYYDGAPMIAYFIYLSTALFGDTLFSLSVIGVIAVGLCTVIVFKTARFFLDKQASYVAALLWLFSPLVTLDLVNQTTYDTPLTLFWALTLYYVVRFIKYSKPADIYAIGICVGLMLLSKYSGIVLLLGILLFVIVTPQRALFKSVHFYGAMLIALILFSPVLIWNYQQDWISFHYQLKTHQIHTESSPLHNLLQSLSHVIIPSLNVMLVFPVVAVINWTKTRSSQNLATKQRLMQLLCVIITFVFLGFYLVVAAQATIRSFWLSQYLISACLLAGYCYERFHWHRTMGALVVLYAGISLAILLNSTTIISFTHAKKYQYFHWMQRFNAQHPQLPPVVVTEGWLEARVLFFLHNKPTIYTLDCNTSLQNQYALWSQEFTKKLSQKHIKHALFIGTYNEDTCLSKYFNHCQRVYEREDSNLMYVYDCYNKNV